MLKIKNKTADMLRKWWDANKTILPSGNDNKDAKQLETKILNQSHLFNTMKDTWSIRPSAMSKPISPSAVDLTEEGILNTDVEQSNNKQPNDETALLSQALAPQQQQPQPQKQQRDKRKTLVMALDVMPKLTPIDNRSEGCLHDKEEAKRMKIEAKLAIQKMAKETEQLRYETKSKVAKAKAEREKFSLSARSWS
ncbi:hypothetical protein BGX27_001182 [Mortierella sp. AM989]|nr:hypothetical protein BGX27_001182 [Mortierella sp. AM989]